MRYIWLDFETFYDSKDGYTLRKMTPVEYVLDHRFELIGCSVKDGRHGKTFWIDGPDFAAWLATIDPTVTCMVTHNALFDMSILSWRYGFVPRLMADTLGISRAVIGYALRTVALKQVSKYLGLGIKGEAVHKMDGVSYAALRAQPWLYNEYVEYGCNDCDLCFGIFEKLVFSGRFPVQELVIMDMVLRCALQPRFLLDQQVLNTHLDRVLRDKAFMLASSIAGDRTALNSNEQFAELLRSLGVDPPTKISPTTGKTAYAFAKTDVDFLELEEHPDHRVQALISARLGNKSTIEESRCTRMLKVANVTWPGNTQGWMPIPLKFSGAHTHRLSGDWKLNAQNLPRPVKGDPQSGALRRALIAPPGYTIVPVDAAQIEARIVVWICGQWDVVDQFAAGEDVYASFASEIFGRTISKDTDPTERFVGKQGILGLGFGLGDVKFRLRLMTDSKNQTGKMIELSPQESKHVVVTYRTTKPCVPATWKSLNYDGIGVLARGGSYSLGPCVFEERAVLGPNGLRLHYHDIHQSDGEWRFTYAGIPKKLYGGKLLENIVQFLARIITMDASVRIQQRMARFNFQGHDELVYIVPTAEVSNAKEILLEEMQRRPVWAPELPLAAETGEGQSYGAAK